MPITKMLSLLWLLFMPVITWAADATSTGGETPIGQGLGYFIDAMYGTTGVTIATLAIMAVGITCLSRFFDWIYFIYCVIGVAIIFGAGTIVTGIQGLIGK